MYVLIWMPLNIFFKDISCLSVDSVYIFETFAIMQMPFVIRIRYKCTIMSFNVQHISNVCIIVLIPSLQTLARNTS